MHPSLLRDETATTSQENQRQNDEYRNQRRVLTKLSTLPEQSVIKIQQESVNANIHHGNTGLHESGFENYDKIINLKTNREHSRILNITVLHIVIANKSENNSDRTFSLPVNNIQKISKAVIDIRNKIQRFNYNLQIINNK